MNDFGTASATIADLLHLLQTRGGLEFAFEIQDCNGQPPTSSGNPEQPATAADPIAISAPEMTAPEIIVQLSGPDTPLLLSRNGELLHAIEHLAAKVLRLEPEQHDRIFFDADNFKAQRDLDLQAAAHNAIQTVRSTGRPFAFPPMSSRERRILHLLLRPSGLPTASSGELPRRFVVLYPEGHIPTPSVPTPGIRPLNNTAQHDRTRAVRNSFRRR